jgi:hypothetical protein
MCFSWQASFGVAAVLVPSGLYCLQSAARKDPRTLPVAFVPVLFGVQQSCEGVVWQGLLHEDPELTRVSSLAFIFVALALWPFWIPFMMWVKETHPVRRVLLFGLTLLGTGWFWTLYLPLLTGPTTLLTAQIDHHSIAYVYAEPSIALPLPSPWQGLPYWIAIVLPLLVSSDKRAYLFALLIGVAGVVAMVLYHYAFTSVWCFFAASITVLMVVSFHGLAVRRDVDTIIPSVTD